MKKILSLVSIICVTTSLFGYASHLGPTLDKIDVFRNALDQQEQNEETIQTRQHLDALEQKLIDFEAPSVEVPLQEVLTELNYVRANVLKLNVSALIDVYNKIVAEIHTFLPQQKGMVLPYKIEVKQ